MKRRTMCQIMLASGAASLLPIRASAAETGEDVFTVIKTRRSVRQYTDEPVSEADIKTMLECAMLAPSAANEQPWEFVVIRDRDELARIGRINQYASFAKKAPLAILVCLNESRETIKGMAILDVGMASQNLLLAARGLGLGAVFTGIYPIRERMADFAKLCNLPANVLPIGLIVIGHPLEKDANRPADRYQPAAVHQNKW